MIFEVPLHYSIGKSNDGAMSGGSIGNVDMDANKEIGAL